MFMAVLHSCPAAAPVPPRQYPLQEQLFRAFETNARNLSAAAVPRLLEVLNSTAVRVKLNKVHITLHLPIQAVRTFCLLEAAVDMDI